MEKHYVRASFNLACNWEGSAPAYRVYVNDELFTERQWHWDKSTLIKEILQMDVPVGIYQVRVESVDPGLATFITSKHEIEVGPACWRGPELIKVKV